MIETGGGISLLILVPLVFFGVGVVFLFVVFRSEGRRSRPGVTDLSARARHPLRHVQVALNASRKQARQAAGAKPPESDPGRKDGQPEGRQPQSDQPEGEDKGDQPKGDRPTEDRPTGDRRGDQEPRPSRPKRKRPPWLRRVH